MMEDDSCFCCCSSSSSYIVKVKSNSRVIVLHIYIRHRHPSIFTNMWGFSFQWKLGEGSGLQWFYPRVEVVLSKGCSGFIQGLQWFYPRVAVVFSLTCESKVKSQAQEFDRKRNKLWLKLCQAHIQFRFNSDLVK